MLSPGLSFALVLACATPVDTADSADTGDTADTADSGGPSGNLCGTVSRPDEAPPGGDVYVVEVLEGATACDDDTGSAGWWGTVAAQTTVQDEAFDATVGPGTYGVEVDAGGNWGGCVGVEVTDTEACAHEVLVELGYEVPVDKPNVYLYPEVPMAVRVALPGWRRITEADPLYPPGGWSVQAFPDGRLATAAGDRGYLFYELRWPVERLQTEAGWCVPGPQAQASIEDAMAQLGFLPREIADFAEAWDPLFPEADTMTIFPQVELAALRVEPAPDHLLRAWFHVTAGCHARVAPELAPVPREGFHAAEWGVSFQAPLDAGEVFVGGWR